MTRFLSVKQRSFLNKLLAGLAARFGATIRDHNTGEALGTAFLFTWFGRIYFLGYRGEPIVPVFIGSPRMLYWKLTLAFRRRELPDYPSLLAKGSHS